MTCDCAWSAASAALAPEGAAVTHFFHAAFSAASTPGSVPPCAVNHVCAATMAACALLGSGARAVTHPAQAEVPLDSVPRLVWKPSVAPVTGVVPVPVSSPRFAPAVSTAYGLLLAPA